MKFKKEFDTAYNAEFARQQRIEHTFQTGAPPSYAEFQRVFHDAAIKHARERVAALEAQHGR